MTYCTAEIRGKALIDELRFLVEDCAAVGAVTIWWKSVQLALRSMKDFIDVWPDFSTFLDAAESELESTEFIHDTWVVDAQSSCIALLDP